MNTNLYRDPETGWTGLVDDQCGVNTATITVEQARRAVDRLHAKIDAFQGAAYLCGASAADMERDPGKHAIEHAAAAATDRHAKIDCYDELARVRELIVGLIAERDRAAGAA